MRKKVWLFALAAVLLVILAGCRGNELPDGMDEDKVSSAGLAVMSQLTKGEYEEVYDALREDVREQTSADDIKKMMDAATEGRGSFKKVKDSSRMPSPSSAQNTTKSPWCSASHSIRR